MISSKAVSLLKGNYIMELLQLRYFYESAKTENFAKTAEKYMVPTTSVSASVRRLEKELDVKLFDRLSNRIILNAQGRKLFLSLKNIFGELDQTVTELSIKEKDTRRIKIYARQEIGQINTIVRNFLLSHPNVLFEIRDDFTIKRPEDFDIMIDCDPYTPDGFETFLYFPMRKCLKVSSDSPLAHQKLQLNQLKNQPFITMGEKDFAHQFLVEKCRQAGFVPNFTIICNDTKSMEIFLQAGIVIGYGGLRSFENAGVSNLDVVDLNIQYNIYAHFKKSANYGNVEIFLNHLREEYEKQLKYVKTPIVNPLQIK